MTKTQERWLRFYNTLQAFEIPESEIQPQYWKGFKKTRVFPRQCFKKSMEYILAGPCGGVTLVHGFWSDHFANHGWIEIPGDIIYDGTVRRYYQKQKYIELHNCRTIYTYSSSEALNQYQKHDCDLSWSDVPEYGTQEWRKLIKSFGLKIPW